MRLRQLIKSLGGNQINCHLEDFEIKGISCNSKDILDNFIFVAIKGNCEDGHRFIKEAVDRGARAVIVHSSQYKVHSEKKIPLIKVEDTRKVLAKLAAEFYGNPSRQIKVIGITGTNGKTTVSYLIEAVLKKAGLRPAVIGTINYRFKDKIIISKNTTPGPIEIQSMLADILKEGTDYTIIEVSSHALDQDRVGEINFHSAIFTNLTQDHLDYHHTIEDYFQAKLKLFTNFAPHSHCLINNDDEYGRRIKSLSKGTPVTYGINNQADIVAKDIKFDISHTEFILETAKAETNFRTSLIGRHNVYNVLACVGWALEEGLDLSLITSAIKEFRCVPGRLERIDSKSDFSVFVDYAHTEDALRNAITTLREISKGRIIVVFGCGGERDKNKRPKMGRVVSKLANYAIITNDNPRGEDPLEIIYDITKGIRKNNYCVIPDRAEAIRKSLKLAKKGDIVLVAGKGHEDYQILRDKKVHFNDCQELRECLKSMNY